MYLFSVAGFLVFRINIINIYNYSFPFIHNYLRHHFHFLLIFAINYVGYVMAVYTNYGSSDLFYFSSFMIFRDRLALMV